MNFRRNSVCGSVRIRYQMLSILFWKSYNGVSLSYISSLQNATIPTEASLQRRLVQRWREVKSHALPGSTSERWWGTRKPGVLQSTGSQRVQHSDWTIRTLCGNLWWRRLELRNLTVHRVLKATDRYRDDGGLNLSFEKSQRMKSRLHFLMKTWR